MKLKITVTVFVVALLGVTILMIIRFESVFESLNPSIRNESLTTQLMERKQQATLELRDALQSGDFGRSEDKVHELRQISVVSEWYLQDQQYADLSEHFRRALDMLDRELAQRDAKKAHQAYELLNKSCMSCHRQAAESRLDPSRFKLVNGK